MSLSKPFELRFDDLGKLSDEELMVGIPAMLVSQKLFQLVYADGASFVPPSFHIAT
jgi:hypothetical protein